MDYKKYRFSRREWIIVLAEGVGLLGSVGYIFYQSLIGAGALILMLPLYIRWKREKKAEQRRWELTLAFKDAINSISAALSAGYSMENSFREALRDLRRIYPEDADIIREFARIITGLEHHITAEEGIQNLAQRSGIEEIRSFSQVIQTGRRTGGNLVALIAGMSRNIEEKVEMKRELYLMVASRRLESRIMNAIPLGMILYMWICSPGFMDPLYHNLFGIITMTGALVLYAAAFLTSEQILKIRL